MTARRHVHIGSLVVIALGYLVGLAAYPFFPGSAIDFMPGARAQVAFSLPTTTLVLYLIFRSLWRHDRVRTGNGAFEATYYAIVFRAMLFVFAMHALLMLALTDVMDVVGTHVWGKRLVVVMFGLVIIAIGNLLPRTRPNVAFGVRTARTLANPQVWQQVHRAGGYIAVGLGASIVVAGLVVTRNGAAGFILLASAVAVALVYISYRRYASV